MARKDVDLVIRAKDEAAKVVTNITAAINEFIEAQNDLGKSAGKTSSTLGALGSAIGALDKELSGLSVSSKLSSELNKATSASERLKAEFEQTQRSAQELARDLQRAEHATDRLSAKTQGAAAAQQKQAAVLDKQKAAQKELSVALADATRERDKLLRAEQRQTQALEKQSERVSKAADRYDRLKTELAAMAAPTKTFQNRVEAAGQSLANQSTRLTELQGKYDGTRTAIVEAEQAVRRYTDGLEKSNAAVARQETVVAKIGENFRNLREAEKAAARNQKEVAAAVDKTADALERQSSRIDRAESELKSLAGASEQAEVAMAQLAGQAGSALERAFAQQRRAMLEAKREWIQSTEAATKLATSISRVGVPTREMAEAFIRNRNEAALSKQVYGTLRESVHSLSGVLRQSGTDLESLSAKQRQFAQIQTQTERSVRGLREEAARTGGAYGVLTGQATRAASAVRQTGTSIRAAATSTQGATRATNSLSDAYRRLYGESRQALSFTQRLRGEVLALISAYGGIYGVISLLRQTTDAYQTLEAAQSRLNVAFEGNQDKTARELDFLRRNANRLGIEFGALANEYSKFAIATQGTALEGQKTRDIFISVAEAARVNKSSFDQLRGTFTALTQIVSKGAVQMEELRQQLGDRLPGALQLMADGLGVGTEELIKMMEQGQVTAEALIPFAEELDRRFGPGLADALKTTTTAFGQFRNAAFQALLAFGQGGFIDAFTDLLRDLTEVLQSADFQAFAERVSQGFAVLIDALGLAARNFDLLVISASAFAGIKLTPLIVALASQFGVFGSRIQRVGRILAATRNVMAATTASTAGMAAATGVATTALRGLALAVRALVSSTGIGLIVTAISVGIGYWATRADEATEALNRHQKLVDQVKDTYESAGKSASDWAEALKKIPRTTAQINLTSLTQQLKEFRESTRSVDRDIFRTDTGNVVAQLNKAVKAFKDTSLSAEEFRQRVDEIAQANPQFSRDIIAELIKVADEAENLEGKVAEARDVWIAMTGTAEEAEAALRRLAGETEEVGDAAAASAKKAEQFQSALAEINKILPDISRGLEDMKEKADLDAAFQSAARAAQTMGELALAVDAYNGALGRIQDKSLGEILSGRGAGGSLADRIIGVESAGNPLAKNKNSTATGLGQFIESTWLRLFKQYFPDRAASLNDAMILELRKNASISRNLVEIYARENAAILQKAGVAVNDAALYLAHFLGPGGAISVLSASADTPVSELLGADQIAANKSILSGKNAGQVLEFAQRKMGISQQELAIQQELTAEEQRRAQEIEKQNEATQGRIESNEQAITQQQLINAGKEREAEIEKAILEARKADPNISDAEIAKIREQTGALFDLQKVRELDKNQQKEAEALMQRVNALLAQRTALEQQLKTAQQSGDLTQVEETQTAIANINTVLDEAILKARAMWESIGGAAADTALIKLDTAAIKAQNLANKAQQNYIDWQRVGQLFASGLTNAFDQFAKAVAEGKDIGEAARDAFLQFASDFLRQIAQMIIQQAIFNALKAFGLGGGGGGGGGGIVGALLGSGHTGGLVGSKRIGSGNRTMRLHPSMLSSLGGVYHNGGVVGLKPNESLNVLKKNEEVLTEDDPRHMFNGGGTQQSAESLREKLTIVNAFDPESYLDRALSGKVGEQMFLNWVRDNPEALTQALEAGG